MRSVLLVSGVVVHNYVLIVMYKYIDGLGAYLAIFTLCVCAQRVMCDKNVSLHTYWSIVFVKRMHTACSSTLQGTREVCYIY